MSLSRIVINNYSAAMPWFYDISNIVDRLLDRLPHESILWGMAIGSRPKIINTQINSCSYYFTMWLPKYQEVVKYHVMLF